MCFWSVGYIEGSQGANVHSHWNSFAWQVWRWTLQRMRFRPKSRFGGGCRQCRQALSFTLRPLVYFVGLFSYFYELAGVSVKQFQSGANCC
jgi:hypothetical protein